MNITAPGLDGTEVTAVINGLMGSEYCQDNIIKQHIDDEAGRSVNHPNIISGLKNVILYKVYRENKIAITSATTRATFWSSKRILALICIMISI